MSLPLVVAAVLLIGMGLFHSILGERYILIRLFRRENLPRLFGSDWFTKRTLRFAWHLMTVAWWGLAAILLVLADHYGGPAPSTAPLVVGTDPLRLIGHVIAVTLAIHAVVAFAGTRGRHLSWIVFGMAAALTWVGM